MRPRRRGGGEKRIISHFLKRPTEADAEAVADAEAGVEAGGPQTSINHPHFYSKTFFLAAKKHLPPKIMSSKKFDRWPPSFFLAVNKLGWKFFSKFFFQNSPQLTLFESLTCNMRLIGDYSFFYPKTRRLF